MRASSIWEDEGVQSGSHEEHWLQAEREILHEFDQLDGNDVPNLEALREAAREHTDAFIVATDLIDARRRRGFASSLITWSTVRRCPSKYGLRDWTDLLRFAHRRRRRHSEMRWAEYATAGGRCSVSQLRATSAVPSPTAPAARQVFRLWGLCRTWPWQLATRVGGNGSLWRWFRGTDQFG
ncbi:hypothetical protein AMC81_PE00843 (plasmid) [Rhizobium phaseoli]|uniref:DUF2934 domain-containing protein n=1 Tax=Rhizobium phaseoli TaxID=396 RepID=A0ABN4QUF2_9HYPH|nr:hypothetical protein AMC81_PE00843 [Rhizobium phaseoli]ANL95595.1 hypothetical protein AMC80_PE00843 [Rhizobium phaseoli]